VAPVFGPRSFLAFDAGSVSGAVVQWSLKGLRVRSVSRTPLPAGALVPSVLDANVQRLPEVLAALASVRMALSGQPETALVLPDGIARIALLTVPPGAEPADFARFRLGPALPYPASEAIVDVLRVAPRLYLGAAVRRRVVESYEAAAAAAGFDHQRIDLAPLATLAALLRHRPPAAGSLDLILGDVAASLVAYGAGSTPVVFRTRLRAPGSDEVERLREEIARTAAIAGLEVRGVRVVGVGAPELIRGLAFAGVSAAPSWDAPREGLPHEAAEMGWLGAALA
jgi:hypothetical protein